MLLAFLIQTLLFCYHVWELISKCVKLTWQRQGWFSMSIAPESRWSVQAPQPQARCLQVILLERRTCLSCCFLPGGTHDRKSYTSSRRNIYQQTNCARSLHLATSQFFLLYVNIKRLRSRFDWSGSKNRNGSV